MKVADTARAVRPRSANGVKSSALMSLRPVGHAGSSKLLQPVEVRLPHVAVHR